MAIPFRRSMAIFLLLLVLPHDAGAATSASTKARRIERTIDAMSDDQRVAQLLFVGFDGRTPSEELRRLAGQWHVGGLVFYAYNIDSPSQVKQLTRTIRDVAGTVAPFIAVDQEGGIVDRLRTGVPVLPSAMALAATRSPDLARRAGLAVGAALRELGFTMNFAPVLDVLGGSRNDAIGTRSLGDMPSRVAEMGAAFIEGQESSGVVSVAKHFPGQGGAPLDTHVALPTLDITVETLTARDLVPFRRGFNHGLRAVMTGHVALPRITERADLPATLSHRVMTDILRQDLEFRGVAISDALQMSALSKQRGAGRLALDALLAGADMVMALGNPKEREEVFTTLKAAYRDGRLPKAQVRQSLRRILAVKMDAAARPRPLQSAGPLSGDAIVSEIARRALTMIGSQAGLVPIASGREGVLYVGPDGVLRNELAPPAAIPLPPALDAAARASRLLAATAAARRATLCVAAARNEDQFELIRKLRESIPDMPMLFINLGLPHRIIRGLKAATILTYSDSAASQYAAARLIITGAKAEGRSPVRLAR